jgi:hypothetical protein
LGAFCALEQLIQMKSRIALILCGVTIGVLCWRLWRVAAQLETRRAEAASAPLPENGWKRETPDDAELARLRSDQREAIKLRGEVAALKAALANAEKEKSTMRMQASAREAPPRADDAPLPPSARVSGASLSANLPSGYSMVLGDMKSTPGKLLYFIATPAQDESNPNVVNVQGRWIEFADDKERPEDLDLLRTKDGQIPRISSEQLTELIETLSKASGLDILTSPRISTSFGTRAEFSVFDTRETPDGPVNFGPSMSVLPTLATDGSINLAVQTKITMPQPESKPEEEEK